MKDHKGCKRRGCGHHVEKRVPLPQSGGAGMRKDMNKII